MVPFDGKLTELQTGPPVPFAELSWREQADVLREFIHWNHYPERAWNDEYTIRENIAAGKQPGQWLEGTFLRQSFQLLGDGQTPPPAPQCPEITEQDLTTLRAALEVAEANRPAAKADETTISLQDLRQESQQRENRGEDRKSKVRDIER